MSQLLLLFVGPDGMLEPQQPPPDGGPEGDGPPMLPHMGSPGPVQATMLPEAWTAVGPASVSGTAPSRRARNAIRSGPLQNDIMGTSCGWRRHRQDSTET